jgi:copper resistance protein D
MNALYIVSLSLHVLSACVWVGGMVFFAAVMVPLSRKGELESYKDRLLLWSGLRFRAIGWICLSLLVLTGLYNLHALGFHWADAFDGRLWQGPFGHTLAHKLVLVAIILLISALHDFWIGPKAVRLKETAGGGSKGRSLSVLASWIARFNLIFAVVVVILGVILARGGA